MGEWLKPAVLKTVSGVTRSGVRIPLPPPARRSLDLSNWEAAVKLIREWESNKPSNTLKVGAAQLEAQRRASYLRWKTRVIGL
jgi:hypothetical protein